MALALVQRFDMDVALLGHQCTYRIIGICAGYIGYEASDDL